MRLHSVCVCLCRTDVFVFLLKIQIEEEFGFQPHTKIQSILGLVGNMEAGGRQGTSQIESFFRKKKREYFPHGFTWSKKQLSYLKKNE